MKVKRFQDNKTYYANNLIPIVFGNKQTIEFRIHTPTYDIGKIINFLFFNIYLIDFTITNLQTILLDPSFLVKIGDFRRFIEIYLKNVKLDSTNKKRLIDYHISYINSRIKQTEIANTLGLIEGDESKIKCSSYIQWNSVDNKLKHESVEIPEYFHTDTVPHYKLKPIDIIKKSIKLDNQIKKSPTFHDPREDFFTRILEKKIENNILYDISSSSLKNQKIDIDKQVFNVKSTMNEF